MVYTQKSISQVTERNLLIKSSEIFLIYCFRVSKSQSDILPLIVSVKNVGSYCFIRSFRYDWKKCIINDLNCKFDVIGDLIFTQQMISRKYNCLVKIQFGFLKLYPKMKIKHLFRTIKFDNNVFQLYCA